VETPIAAGFFPILFLLRTGSCFQYRFFLHPPGHYSSPTDQWLIGGPVVADGVVYLGSSDQRLFHAIDAADGGLLWTKELDCRIWGSALEERMESYRFNIPENLQKGVYYLTAQMNYRRMPDPLADYFGIDRRPVMEVSKDVKKLVLN